MTNDKNNNEISIKVESLSKKFCKNLKQTMIYGTSDISRNMLGLRSNSEKLRKGEFWALDNISFNLKKGELLGIIGDNGSGKTTLLKILSGILMPDKGKITIHGKIGGLIAVGAGFHPMLTGRENIYINGSILGLSKKEIDKKFEEIVSFADIGDFLDTPIKHYSSGMHVRLGFAIAVNAIPEILVVDEVLAVGDAEFRKKCLGTMNKVTKTHGRSILFVSHNMNAIQDLCHRCVLLDDGKIKMIGKTREVIKKYLNNDDISQSLIQYPKNNNKKVQIKEIAILDNNYESNTELDTNKPFNIKISYNIKEDLTKKNTVFIRFYDTVNNNIIFETCDIDTNEQLYQNRKIGHYSSTFKFPANFLNRQQCYIRIGCGIPRKHNFSPDKESFFDFKDGIRINFFNTPDFASKFFGGGRPGNLLLKIPCEVTKK